MKTVAALLLACLSVATAAPSLLGHGIALAGPATGPNSLVGPSNGPSALAGPVVGPSRLSGAVDLGAVVSGAVAGPSASFPASVPAPPSSDTDTHLSVWDPSDSDLSALLVSVLVNIIFLFIKRSTSKNTTYLFYHCNVRTRSCVGRSHRRPGSPRRSHRPGCPDRRPSWCDPRWSARARSDQRTLCLCLNHLILSSVLLLVWGTQASVWPYHHGGSSSSHEGAVIVNGDHASHLHRQDGYVVGTLARHPIVVAGPNQLPSAVIGPSQGPVLVQGPQQGSVAVVGPTDGGARVIGPNSGGAAIIGPSSGGAQVVGPNAGGATIVGPGGGRIIAPAHGPATIIGPTHGGATIVGPTDGGARVVGPVDRGATIVGPRGSRRHGDRSQIDGLHHRRRCSPSSRRRLHRRRRGQQSPQLALGLAGPLGGTQGGAPPEPRGHPADLHPVAAQDRLLQRFREQIRCRYRRVL
ncbi:unnamed protein product [Trichogramma brassicae]|uniref:Uncharacterized protein n=1 Tax=Trichogramma brassicae TaxID=86971 RepID=A0A6H5IE70_9HYME|nr:unnamed protein product [Trichogramma brassicae]